MIYLAHLDIYFEKSFLNGIRLKNVEFIFFFSSNKQEFMGLKQQVI